MEDKLRYLEEREREIKYNEMKSASSISVHNENEKANVLHQRQQRTQQSSINSNNVLIMSGKCVAGASVVAGDSTDRSSQHTVVSSYGMSSNIEEQRMREYQQSLLLRDTTQQQQQRQNSQEIDLSLNVEMRKKEILQRFGLTDMTNFNEFNNERQLAPSIAQQSEDKHTISTDSGFASWRNQNQHVNGIFTQHQKTSLKSSSIRSDANYNTNINNNNNNNNNQDTSFESNIDQLEHDNMVVTGLQNNNKQSKLFGLEYFDVQNGDIRDASIAQLIGWYESQNSSSKLTINKSNLSSNSVNEMLKQLL